METQHWLLVLGYSAVTGCFSPDPSELEAMPEGSTSEATTETPGSPGTTDAPLEPSDTTSSGSSGEAPPSDDTDPDPPDPSTTTGPSDDDTGETDETGDTSTTEPDQPVVCGDGEVAGDEVCDDGGAPPSIGGCRPDCAGFIQERRITFSDPIDNGNLGSNPVATADAHCPDGFAAMFSFANLRRASFDPLEGNASVDWVLQPYTAYTNDDSELVWLTDDVPLLGVRDGELMPLINGVEDVVCEGSCPLLRMITGMNANWTSLSNNTCGGWSNTSGVASIGTGNHLENYLQNQTIGCSNWIATYFYCVEQ